MRQHKVDYYDIDIDSASHELKEASFKVKCEGLLTNFITSNSNSLTFYNESLSARLAIIQMAKDGLKDTLLKYKISVSTFHNFLNINEYESMIHEKEYINTFQAFEVYLSHILKVIFWFSPNLLPQNELLKYKKSDGIEKLMDRREIIDKYVNKIMRENIVDTIQKYYELLNTPNTINSNDTNNLYVISLIRNQIVHNQGIIDKLFESKLQRKGISNKFEIGDYVFDNKYYEETRKDIGILLKNIASTIKNTALEWHTIHLSS